MRPIQNAGGHVGLTARNYPIAYNTAVKAGQVVKLSGALVVTAAAAETGAVLGVAAENHPGTADPMNARANGTEILVYDNPELICECPVPVIAAASGSATTIVPKSGDVASTVADDGYNGAVLVLKGKAAGSTNTDPLGKRITVTDYTKSGTVITKASGGAPAEGDVYEMYTGYSGGGKKMIADYEAEGRSPLLDAPRQYGLSQAHKHLPEMAAICGLDSDTRSKRVVSATGATAVRVIGHDFDRHMIRCMAVKHALGGTN